MSYFSPNIFKQKVEVLEKGTCCHKQTDGKILEFINKHGEKVANIVQLKSRVDKQACLLMRQVRVTVDLLCREVAEILASF